MSRVCMSLYVLTASRKTSAGYNLTGLFAGSEGTLGMITEVTLKLAPIPETQSVAVATFPSVRSAVTCVSKIMRQGIPMAAVELMDEVQMAVLNKNGGAGGRMWEEKPTILFKYGAPLFTSYIINSLLTALQVFRPCAIGRGGHFKS